MLIVKGYVCEAGDLLAIEETIQKLRDLITIQGHKLYTELFAKEIELLFDDVALNVVPRPQIPIYDAAKQMLDQKIGNATGRGLLLPYNFGIQISIYSYKGHTYIRLNTNNERLIRALKKAPAGLKDYSLFDDRQDNAEQKSRETVWNEIMEAYSGDRTPFSQHIFACEGVNPDWKKISEKFSSRTQRAELRVRYQQTNQLINLIGMGQQIPPHKMMPYFDEALLYLSDDAVVADAKRLMPQALQSVINITEELVKHDPQDDVPQGATL
jgi:hypothetical protein